MSLSQYICIVLNERPGQGPVKPETLRTEKRSTEELKASMKDTNVFIRVDYLSLDPAMRGWLNNVRSYLEPVQIGAIMRAGGLGAVLAVESEDTVNGMPDWTEYAVLPAKAVRVVRAPEGGVPLDYVGVLGMTGETDLGSQGLFDVAQLKAGETLVVSGAAGATGSVGCQLGKMIGAKFIAISGADDKFKWLEEDLGVDKALNYKSATFTKDFKESLMSTSTTLAAGIYWICLSRLNKHARITLCGAVSTYNDTQPNGIRNYPSMIAQGAKMQGFVITDYAPRFAEALGNLGEWLGTGKLKRKFYIQNGLEKAPEHLQELFAGRNMGKMYSIRSSLAPWH